MRLLPTRTGQISEKVLVCQKETYLWWHIWLTWRDLVTFNCWHENPKLIAHDDQSVSSTAWRLIFSSPAIARLEQQHTTHSVAPSKNNYLNPQPSPAQSPLSDLHIRHESISHLSHPTQTDQSAEKWLGQDTIPSPSHHHTITPSTSVPHSVLACSHS